MNAVPKKVTKIKFDRSKQKENLVDYKYKKLFKFKALSKRDAKHGVMGIPRVLNLYENYPLWHTILTDLGFRVQISPKSDKKLYQRESKPFQVIPFVTLLKWYTVIFKLLLIKSRSHFLSKCHLRTSRK